MRYFVSLTFDFVAVSSAVYHIIRVVSPLAGLYRTVEGLWQVCHRSVHVNIGESSHSILNHFVVDTLVTSMQLVSR